MKVTQVPRETNLTAFEFELTADELLLGISELGGRRPDPLQGWEPAAEPSERSFVSMEILLVRVLLSARGERVLQLQPTL